MFKKRKIPILIIISIASSTFASERLEINDNSTNHTVKIISNTSKGLIAYHDSDLIESTPLTLQNKTQIMNSHKENKRINCMGKLLKDFLQSGSNNPLMNEKLTNSSSNNKQLNITPVKISDKTRTELIGKITNQYGIRDDILEFILNTIPPENKQGIEAAIHYAQNNAEILFTDNPEQVRHTYGLLSNILICMRVFLDNKDLYYKNLYGIDKLYRNTPERNLHAKNVEDSILSGHIYGSTGIMAHSDLSGYQDEVKFCKAGGVYWK